MKRLVDTLSAEEAEEILWLLNDPANRLPLRSVMDELLREGPGDLDYVMTYLRFGAAPWPGRKR